MTLLWIDKSYFKTNFKRLRYYSHWLVAISVNGFIVKFHCRSRLRFIIWRKYDILVTVLILCDITMTSHQLALLFGYSRFWKKNPFNFWQSIYKANQSETNCSQSLFRNLREANKFIYLSSISVIIRKLLLFSEFSYYY